MRRRSVSLPRSSNRTCGFLSIRLSDRLRDGRTAASNRRRLRLAIELVRKAPDRNRCRKAHRQSPRSQAFFASASEVRGLGSAGIARPRRSYAPVRLPFGPPSPRDRVEASASPSWVSPDYSHRPSNAPRPLPRLTQRVHVSTPSPLARPSPVTRRVGLRISTSEACSAPGSSPGVTHVTARWIAQPPETTPGLDPGAPARPVTQPNRSSATRSIDNSLGGIFLHW